MKDIELKMLDIQAMDTKTMIEQNGGFVPAAAVGSALIAAIPTIALVAATVTVFAMQIYYLVSISYPKESPPTKKA